MIIITSYLSAFYILLLLLLMFGLKRLKPGKNQIQFSVSVIIAARNEQQHIENCIKALISQNYPSKKYEIIIIDDRSTDNTAPIISKYAELHKNISLIKLTQTAKNISPKKYAIDIGIRKSRGEIILITDADCIPQPGWIKSMVSHFEPDVGLVAGFSPLEKTDKPSLFKNLLALDALSLASVAAGSFGAGFPLTCNARNLAYRREVFKQVGGFSQINHMVSGDDDLFLHLIKNKTDWQVRYNIDKNSIVVSIPPKNFDQFSNQRKRHASKGKHYSWRLKAGLIVVYLYNLSFLLLLALSFVNLTYLYALIINFSIKSITEYTLINRAAKIFNRSRYLKYFPVAAMIHIPYVVIFGLWGQVGKFSWKGEQFQAKLTQQVEIKGN